ncbi:MAG: 30S ribosomal protein S12 methylthiotransferase RimO [Firmicutes bacterium]|nr:30S ribosomal protein S12 methylthiotransferase RimO [Bacillota bacterium]
MSQSIGMVSLGCAKNQVDAEQMLFLLQQAGYNILPEPAGADVVIVNTCGFIESAKTEAIDNILAMAQLKAEGSVGKILVTGCLAQRYQEEILKELPEVDGVLGTGSYYDVVSAVKQLLDGAEGIEEYGDIQAPVQECGRILTTPKHYAYLKIAEGCDNHCAFCIIPTLRGKYRSRPMEKLIEEAKELAASGVKELIVVAQDTSRYGIDLYGERKLAELLRELCKIDGFVWVRVHYLYPDEMSDELIDVLANEPKIVKYLDIPIQHIDDGILKKMNRRGNSKYLKALLTKLRDCIPGLVLRTSLITGLPGEGEKEFEALCDFLREYKLERVGAFAFSPEEGTRAAKMEYPDAEVARQRADVVEEIQSRIMDEWNESMMGKKLQVLCEGYDADEECWYGRTFADSPDIDGRILFDSDEELTPGDFVTVEVTDACDGELIGVMEDAENDNCE